MNNHHGAVTKGGRIAVTLTVNRGELAEVALCPALIVRIGEKNNLRRGFRVGVELIADNGQHPDHETICSFRQRHLRALSELFVQVLQLSQKAGLVRLGHIALDGTKVGANASKHKAVSYSRMKQELARLEGEVEQLLARAESIDTEEDALYGTGKRGDELPQASFIVTNLGTRAQEVVEFYNGRGTAEQWIKEGK